jgi:hypothetical protein
MRRLIHDSTFLATHRARVFVTMPPRSEGAGKAGCAASTHSLACKMKQSTRA